MYPRILQIPKESFFLFGPRGSGKTHLLETSLKVDHQVELLSQENFIRYASEPGLFRRQIENLKPGSWVWVDEIQRIPELLNEVHWGIEKKKIKFALSGSSARKLRRSGVNLLAGRAEAKYLYPFIPTELGKDFSLADALQFGTLPIIFSADDKKQKLRSYIQTYIKEEIQTEALVKDLPAFLRFLKVSALLHGQTLSLSSVARDVSVKRPTVENYFSILEDTLLAKLLYPLESNLRVKEKRHPKFYWVDAGIVRGIREEWGHPSPFEIGSLFEGYIFNLLRSYQSYKNSIDEINFWASSNVEVDFLVKFNSHFVAIEAKTSKKFRNEDAVGLRSLVDLPNLKRRIIVYPEVDTQKTHDGIEIMGFEKFSKVLNDGLF